MKILHLVHWKKSGIYVAAAALKAEGQKHGDTHDIIVLREDSSLRSSIISILSLIQFIFKANLSSYDRVNLHSFLPYLSSFFCFGGKTVLFFHSNYPFLKGRTTKDKIKLLLTQLSNKKRRPIAVSNIVKQCVDEALNVDCKILYNIIKHHTTDNHPSSVIHLGAAGRFDPEKRFIELTEKFITSNSNCTLHLAGDGKLLEKAVLYSKENAPNKVVFHGRQSSMENFYQMIDAYICCSEFEGFGLVIAEAMIYGKIIISTKVGILCENIGFKFLEINSDLSNLSETIISAGKMKPNEIIEMVNTNRKLLKDHFTDSSIYNSFKQQQLEII